jgi:hypothetical protein
LLLVGVGVGLEQLEQVEVGLVAIELAQDFLLPLVLLTQLQ